MSKLKDVSKYSHVCCKNCIVLETVQAIDVVTTDHSQK